MELVKPRLVKGDPYLAFVRVTPYYEEGSPQPVMLRYNELQRREKKQQSSEELTTHSSSEELM